MDERDYLTDDLGALVELQHDGRLSVTITIDDQTFSSADLREAALLFYNIADALELSAQTKH